MNFLYINHSIKKYNSVTIITWYQSFRKKIIIILDFFFSIAVSFPRRFSLYLSLATIILLLPFTIPEASSHRDDSSATSFYLTTHAPLRNARSSDDSVPRLCRLVVWPEVEDSQKDMLFCSVAPYNRSFSSKWQGLQQPIQHIISLQTTSL